MNKIFIFKYESLDGFLQYHENLDHVVFNQVRMPQFDVFLQNFFFILQLDRFIGIRSMFHNVKRTLNINKGYVLVEIILCQLTCCVFFQT